MARPRKLPGESIISEIDEQDDAIETPKKQPIEPKNPLAKEFFGDNFCEYCQQPYRVNPEDGSHLCPVNRPGCVR